MRPGDIAGMKINIFAAIFSGLLLAAPVARADLWEEDFSKASEQAKQENKYLLANFSGSDWCGWCKKLDKEVFSQKEFKEFAKANLVCALVDFPMKKSQAKKLKQKNKELQEKYSVNGYPSIILISPAGDTVGKTGYRPGGATAYVEHLQAMLDKHRAPSAK
jgi:thioredoxin-related protein